MKRLTVVPALLALLACGPNEEPARPPAEPPKVAVKPKPDPAPATPAPSAAPSPVPPAPPPSPEPAPVVPAPKPRPRREGPAAEVHLPAFTFRTMDHRRARVFLNDEDLNETPCLWTITETIEFDPAIKVASWPPEGARYAGATRHPEHPDWNAEVYIGDSKAGESAVYVNAVIQGRTLRGGMRLRVADYRWINYDPLVAPDGEDASRLQRSLWLERTKNE